MYDYIEYPDTPQITVWFMRISCWPKTGCNRTFRICKIYLFYTATIFSPSCL